MGSCSGGFAALGGSVDVGASVESVELRRRWIASDALRMSSDMGNINVFDNPDSNGSRIFGG